MAFFRLAFLAIILCAPFGKAYAAEAITFTQDYSAKDKRIKDLISQHAHSKIAVLDLNNDSIDEFIFSKQITANLNQYELMALTDSGAVSLGAITAKKLMLAYDQHNGVRSILGFSDDKNDFNYDVYAWDALNSSYALESEIKKKGGLK